MFTQKPARRAEIVWLGALITWTAGFVDAVGFITLSSIYVANMSGNTVTVAIHLSKQQWLGAWAHVCPLLAFVPGLVAGDAIVEGGAQLKLKSRLMPAVLLEAMALAGFLVGARAFAPATLTAEYRGGPYALLVGLLAFAMGLQNGALRRVGALKDVHTYVTGTLLAMANGVTRFCFWLGKRLRRLHRAERRRGGKVEGGAPRGRARLTTVWRYALHHRNLRQAALAGMLWTIYLIGAIIGAVGLLHFHLKVLWAPITVLLIIAAADAMNPVRSKKKAEPRELMFPALSLVS